MQVLQKKVYREKYEIPLGWVRFEPMPAMTAAPSPSESGDITTAPLCLLKNKFHGTELSVISLNDLSDRVHYWCASTLIYIYRENKAWYFMIHRKYHAFTFFKRKKKKKISVICNNFERRFKSKVWLGNRSIILATLCNLEITCIESWAFRNHRLL